MAGGRESTTSDTTCDRGLDITLSTLEASELLGETPLNGVLKGFFIAALRVLDDADSFV
jgi:hypothetical protein